MRTRVRRAASRTIALCIGCVQGAGRVVRRPSQRRYERHYHPRLAHGRKHLVADVLMAATIVALIGTNVWLFSRAWPALFPSVRLHWEVPSSVRVGEALALALDFAYDGAESLESVTIALHTSDRVLIHSADPGTFDASTNTLTLPGGIAPGASGRVIVRGVALAPVGEVIALRATLHGTSALRAERRVADARIPVAGTTFAFDLETPAQMRLGESVELRMVYRRAAADAAVPLQFGMRVDGVLMPHSVLEAIPSSLPSVLRNQSVLWDMTVREGGDLTAQGAVRLVPPRTIIASAYPDDARFVYMATPLLVFAEALDGAPLAMVEGDAVAIPIAGVVQLAASARYFTPEGDQVGRGPLPPRVGEQTTYWVTWDVRALIQDAPGIIVRATLPSHVAWTGRVASTAGGPVRFDPASREVTWETGALQRDGDPAYASFAIALTPDARMVGQAPQLLGETIFSDDLGIVGAARADAVTTASLTDARAAGLGVVTR